MTDCDLAVTRHHLPELTERRDGEEVARVDLRPPEEQEGDAPPARLLKEAVRQRLVTAL